MANLFTSQTPAIPDASDGTPGITTATTEVFAEAGQVSGIWFYATATVGGAYSVAFWRVDSSDPGGGTQLATKVLGGAPTPGTWNLVAFDAPVDVVAGVPYRAALFSGAGRYVATVGFFTSQLVNGDMTAPAHNATVGALTISQGTFRVDAAAGYPNGTSGSACYFVAADFTASAGVTGSGALVLPSVTASGAGVSSASGASALTLPALTASGAGTASATGAAALALPALAAVGAGSARAAGAGALTLPALQMTGQGGPLPDEVSAPGPVLRTSSRERTLRTESRGG